MTNDQTESHECNDRNFGEPQHIPDEGGRVPVNKLRSLVRNWREAADEAGDMADVGHSNTSLFLGIKATREYQADELERLIERHGEDE